MKPKLKHKTFCKHLRYMLFCVILILAGCSENKPVKKPQDTYIDSCIKVVFKTSDSLFNAMKYDLAMSYLDSIANTTSFNNQKFLAKKYTYMATLSFNLFKDNIKTAAYLDSLAPLLTSNESVEVSQKIIYNILRGKIAAQKKDYKVAYTSYYVIKRMLDSINDPCVFNAYYNNLGDLLWQQKRWGEALFNWKRGVEIINSCPDIREADRYSQLQVNYDNIGILYENLNQFDSAVVYYKKALDASDFSINKFGKTRYHLRMRAVIIGNLGGTLLKLKQIDEAEKLLTESIKINDQKTYEQRDALLTKIKLAEVYLLKNNLNDFNKLTKEVSADMHEFGGLVAQMRLAKINESYYNKIGDYKNANTFLKLYHSLNDSINKIPDVLVKEEPNRIEEYEEMEKIHEIALMQQQNKTRNIILYVAIGFLFMMLLIIFLVKRNQTITNRQNFELTRLNKENELANNQLSESLLSLQQSYDDNNRILKTVAHDLRSPIAGIMSLVRLIKHDEELSKTELNELIDLVEKSSDNALVFIEDLLLLNNKPETLVKSKIDILPVLESCVQIATVAANTKNQHIQLNATSQELPINQPKIWRVINNLLSNAIKFSNTNTVITIKSKTTANSYIISITDQGIGIPDELKSKMFIAYSGVGRSGTKGEASFGLGLSISKQIIEAHGGKIWFNSEIDKGTTFFVELPLV